MLLVGAIRPGNEPHVVAEQDEEPERADERQKTVAFRTDPLVEEPDHGADGVLHHDLQLAGVLDAQPRPHEQAAGRNEHHDQQDHHEVGRDHFVAGEMKAERLAHPLHERSEQRVDDLHDPEGMFELLHRPTNLQETGSDQGFFTKRRTASTVTAATIEDAPASRPNGCRRKRAIITYAIKASKAYLPASDRTMRPRCTPVSVAARKLRDARLEQPVARTDQQPAAQNRQRRARRSPRDDQRRNRHRSAQPERGVTRRAAAAGRTPLISGNDRRSGTH